jgi:predicted metal-dependent HD superfamily phosphohydrolase
MAFKKWQKLMHAFGFAENRMTFDKLIAAYTEKHRYYHTFEHINACLNHLDKTHDLARYPHEIKLALWFHDAIYKPYSKENELKSANWAVDFLKQNGMDEKTIARVYQLVLVTLHGTKIKTGDEKLIVDIDLTILGSLPKAYNQFEMNVRKEYRFVPFFIYRKKRKEILQVFLEQETIYKVEYFRDKFEKQARKNLTRAIKNL